LSDMSRGKDVSCSLDAVLLKVIFIWYCQLAVSIVSLVCMMLMDERSINMARVMEKKMECLFLTV